MAKSSQYPRKPFRKEPGNKIRAAIAALEAGHYGVIDESRLAQSVEDLGLVIVRKDNVAERVLERVLDLLDEILAAGAFESFCGIGGKIAYCDQSKFQKELLYAYAWDSVSLQKRMYLKFGLKKRGNETVFKYLHLSCHDDE
jgi:hypothetical protein